MSSLTDRWPTPTVPTARWARQVLLAVQVPAVVVPVLFTTFTPFGTSWVRGGWAALLGLVLGGILLRHSLAATRGQRPRGGVWTLLAMAAVIYIPLPWLGLYWGLALTTLIASALMVLGRRTGWIVATAVLAAWTVIVGRGYWGYEGAAAFILDVGGSVVFVVVIGVALFGATRLVRVLDQLESARTELADLAVGQERLRVSRDLHDLLGQSLSAVSLKGDLAIQLLSRDAAAARAEIESLTGVARDALRGVRAITRDEHMVSLPAETEGAAALLGAAGVDVEVHLEPAVLSAPVADVLAWIVREGVTNVLRHSAATACTITATRRGSTAWLEIVNDGAGPWSDEGRGLSGLTERARALGGSVTAERTPDGTFRLLAQIPMESS